MGNTAKRDIRSLERLKVEEEIVARRRQGHTFELIAEELKDATGKRRYTNASGPWKVYQALLKRRREEIDISVDDHRDEMEGQLRAIMRGGLYQKAQRGELQAIDRFVRLQESLRALRGLDTPTNIHLSHDMKNIESAESMSRRVREVFGEQAAVPEEETSTKPDASVPARRARARKVPAGPSTK